MSSIKYTVRQGDTEAINFTLQSDGSGADISSYTSVAMYLQSSVDNTTQLSYDTGTGDFTVIDDTAGTCSISPGETDFLESKSPYNGYVLVVDGSGKRSSFPENGQLVFIVQARLSNDT